MPDARLSVRVPPDTWMYELSTAEPSATFRVLTVLRDGETAFAILEVTAVSPLSLLAAIRERDAIPSVELVSADDETAVVHLETDETGLLDPVAAAGVPLQTPFVVEDGTVVWDLTASADRLATLDDRLEDAGLRYAVEYVRRNDTAPGVPDLLTDRQFEVLERARDLGFLAIPREATLDDVADAVGVSTSTASDLLRRGQRNLAEWYLEAANAGEDV